MVRLNKVGGGARNSLDTVNKYMQHSLDSKCCLVTMVIWKAFGTLTKILVSIFLSKLQVWILACGIFLLLAISWAHPGFLEGGFKSIKRGFVFNILPDFS